MRLRFALFAVLFCCASFVSPSARAVLLPGYAAGVGANTSQLVVDFGFIGGDAYLFEYHYDGSATAEQMLLALDAAGDLTVHHQYFTFGGPPSIYIDGFSFAGHSAVPSFEGANGESWSYWVRDPGVNTFTYWTTPVVGATDRLLVDGSIDGWSLNVSEFNTKGLSATYLPPTTIPEPAGTMVFVLAGIAFTRRRRP